MLSYKCPRCQGALIENADSYTCSACASIYPIIAGIADFRLYADPYIELQADREKGLRLHEQSLHLTFAELVRYYYSITPEVPDDLGQHYTNHHLAGAARGEGVLNRVEQYKLAGNRFMPQMVLDLGCGTGGLLAAASNRFSAASVVGVDIAFRWLIVARKRLQELGWTNVQLVCACADHLPFEKAKFDLVVAENLIEHMSNTDGLFAEIERVRRPNGAFLARTVNRFAFGPEPHVGVWGVGYLPKQLMNPYVQLIKKIPYEHIHLESSRSLNRALSRAQSKDLRVRRAVLTPADYQHHPGWKKKLFRSFEKVASLAGPAEPLFTEIGPYLDVTNARAITAEQNRPQQLSVR